MLSNLWSRATRLLQGKRRIKQAEVEDTWEAATTDIPVPVEDYIPVAARMPMDDKYHPVKVRIKSSGTICFATARFRRGRWEGYTHASPNTRFKVLAWRDAPGVLVSGHAV